jgi:hypothetical protein
MSSMPRFLTAPVVVCLLSLAAALPARGAVTAHVASGTRPPTGAAAAANFSLRPADIHRAYGLPNKGAAHQTIAVVSAYDDPSAEVDLSAYTKRFGVPACTKANGCFRKLNQQGSASPLPPKDVSQAFLTESSVGIEVARGVCQSCKIMLVEANSADKPDVSAAVNAAANAGATVIVTAFNEGQSPGDDSYAPSWTHPRAAVVSASGDTGGTSLLYFPATLPGVLAVGGTQLNLSSAGAYKSESAWINTTSGCSLYTNAGSWQNAQARAVGCGDKRAEVDVSAAAAPGAIVHVQDVGAPCGKSFCEADGTSVAAPIIAGVIGLAGSQGSNELPMLYRHAHSGPSAFHDITTGADSPICNRKLICQARRGYDGPTGLGSPNGLGAFLASGGALNPHRARLTLTAPRNRLSVSRSWRTKLTLRNGNPFAVGGTVTIRQGSRIYASRKFTLNSLGSGMPSLSIPRKQRGTLRRLKSTAVTVQVRLRGPAGKTVTVTGKLRLYAP